MKRFLLLIIPLASCSSITGPKTKCIRTELVADSVYYEIPIRDLAGNIKVLDPMWIVWPAKNKCMEFAE